MNDSRGSIWRKWDLHIHTPLSILNNDFEGDFDNYVKTLFQTAIQKDIAVIGITDYFSIEGYKKIINEYIEDERKLQGLFTEDEIIKIKSILILPNIEFRLHELIDGRRINFHVIFSNDVRIQDIEEHFLHELDFVHESNPFEKDYTRKLKLSNLIDLGKELKKQHPDFSTQDDIYTGMLTATVQHKDISEKLQDLRFDEKYVIGVPADEDLSKIEWSSQGHMIRKSIIQKSNFLFSSNPNTINWALGKLHESQEDYIKEFKSIKPCIWGSDAHDFKKLFEPDYERYCWIKADTTFEGIRQILFEPEERIFIGKKPNLLEIVDNNPTKYFNKLVIKPTQQYNGKNGKWFNNTIIEFNSGLVGIIGNKGKGKSAIADILGLVGNSKVSVHESKDKLFSFLNKRKFCKRGFAENFEATIYWNDKKEITKSLIEDIDLTDNELIKYIPQKFFEELCSTEDDEHFIEELNNVVFSRVENKDRLGKNTFNDFIAYKTELIENDIDNYKKTLENLNSEILKLERKNTDEYKDSIYNKIKGKQDELDAHKKIKEEFVVVENPSDDKDLSEEQIIKSEKILDFDKTINKLQVKIDEKTIKQELLEIEKYELIRFLDDILDLEGYIKQWGNDRIEPLKKYNIDIESIVKFEVNKHLIDLEKKKKTDELSKIENLLSPDSVIDEEENEISLVVQIEKMRSRKIKLEGELEKPFKIYHDYQQQIKDWEIKKTEIEGNINIPKTLRYYQNEKEFIKNILKQELNEKVGNRNSLAISIYRKKKEIQDVFNSIKQAISELLVEYSSDQPISLETSFEIDSNFFKIFFDYYVNRFGDFYQKGENYLSEICSKYNFDDSDNVLEFVGNILKMNIHLKDNIESDFLNYMFSLEFINPRYNLRLNNKGLKELSPGERGGLLLIFYLILDKDDKPLVIDQPEDNLDNQSVSEILVPYIREAKKSRQIIMITHNPNLAVVADADQIIRMNIDKENDFLVSHISGAIENPIINKAVVDILEGKMKAFNNRRLKYYSKE